MSQHECWASLPAELWRRVAAAAAGQLFAPGLQHETLGVLSFQLLARLSCVSTSLRKALLSVTWDMFPFQSRYIGLNVQASSKLNRWRAARLGQARSAILHGGGWNDAVLREVMASVQQLTGTLQLVHMYVASEAACCNAELSRSSLTGLIYQGDNACTFPPALERLRLSQWPRDLWSPSLQLVSKHVANAFPLAGRDCLGRIGHPIAPLLAHLQPLPKLSLLSLVSYGYTLAEQDVQRLAACLPTLNHLHLHLLVSPFSEISSLVKPLASLLPGVRLSLTVLLFPSELRSLAQQLEGIKLGAVDLRCLRDGFSEEAEALLAQCSMERLTVHFADSGTRLRRVPPLPPGAHVRYCKLDPAIAAAALSVSFNLDDLFSSSEEDD